MSEPRHVKERIAKRTIYERAQLTWQYEADLGLLPLSSELFGIELPKDLPENWETFYVPGGYPLYVRRTPSASREVFRGDGPPTTKAVQ